MGDRFRMTTRPEDDGDLRADHDDTEEDSQSTGDETFHVKTPGARWTSHLCATSTDEVLEAKCDRAANEPVSTSTVRVIERALS